jgi:hypothetical protein
MKSAFWLAVLVSVVAAAWVVARIRRTIKERERAEEERAASLLAGLVGTAAAPANPAPQPMRAAVVDELAQQKLLFESAHKAGEAGEPALAIQLYARLLTRYPSSAFSEQACAGAEVQKKKLVKD